MYKKKTYGNFTIEATFILPIVFLLVLLFIYLSFYLYDYCKITATINRALNRNDMESRHEDDIEDLDIHYGNVNQRPKFYGIGNSFDEQSAMTAKYLWEEFERGLLISIITRIEVDINQEYINVYLEYSEDFPLPNILKIFNQRNRGYTIIKRKNNHQPTKYIRVVDLIIETGDSIKGMESVKETLINILNKLMSK